MNRDESTTPAGAGAWMQDGESWQDAAARADQEAQGWYRRELDLDPVTDAAEYTAAQQQVDLWVARPISVLPEDLGAPVADGPYPGVGAADPTDHRDARDAAAPAAEQTVGPGDGDGAPRVEHATAVDAAEPVVDPWGMSPQEWEDHPAYQDWVDAEEGVTPRTGVELDAYWERVLADPERRAAFAAALDRSGQAYIEPPPADLGDPWALDECPRAAEPVADAHAACTQAGRAAERLAEADQQTAHAVLRPVAADDDQLDGVDIDTTQER